MHGFGGIAVLKLKKGRTGISGPRISIFPNQKYNRIFVFKDSKTFGLTIFIMR